MHGHGELVCGLLSCRVNLNQLEGLHCSENGALKQHWSWHDLEPDIHPLPFQPLYLSLNPFISLRILTQERIYLTFSHGTCRVRFNVGAKLKVSLLLSGMQLKSTELFMIVGGKEMLSSSNIQICVFFPCV